MKKARQAQAGLTMVEVVIAAIILSAIVGMSAYLVWSSSRTVSSAEAGLQLENSGREALNAMATELRQARRVGIAKVITTPIRILPPVNNIHNIPVNDFRLGQPVIPCPENQDFDGIRFDLIDPRNKFALDDFKNSVERIYTVQYWWQVEFDEQKGPIDAGNGPNGREPNAIDDNKNGVVDEGVIMKMETWFDIDRVTIEERKLSTVLRNVKKLNFRVPGAGVNPKDNVTYSSDRIEVTISLEIQDPKQGRQKIEDKAGKEAMLMLKTVSAVIDFRN